MKTKLYACLFAMAVLTVTANAKLKSTALTGTWKYTEVKTTGPNARTNSNPQPGLVIFTGAHYSAVRVSSDQPRPPLQDPTKATAAELLAVYGPFTANSGTYEISGGNLTIKSVVAKNPAGMAPGAFDEYSFKLQGNTLTLTSVRDANGPSANPTTITLTRVE
jgi:Lipocalin-like domain